MLFPYSQIRLITCWKGDRIRGSLQLSPRPNPEEVLIAIIQRLIESGLHFGIGNDLFKNRIKAQASGVIEDEGHRAIANSLEVQSPLPIRF